MLTARQVFEHIAGTLNNDAEDGIMSTTTDDDLVFYLLQWQSESAMSICGGCELQNTPGCRIAGLGISGAIKECPKFKA